MLKLAVYPLLAGILVATAREYTDIPEKRLPPATIAAALSMLLPWLLPGLLKRRRR